MGHATSGMAGSILGLSSGLRPLYVHLERVHITDAFCVARSDGVAIHLAGHWQGALECEFDAADAGPKRSDALVRTLDDFDLACGEHIRSSVREQDLALVDPKALHWSSAYVPFALSRYAYNDGTSLVSVKNCKQNTFISLAARFGIFSYVHAKISQDPSLAFQRGTPRTVGILQAAIFPTSNLCLTVAGSSDHETGRHWHPMSSAAPLAECCPPGVVPNVDDARHYAKRLQIIRLLFSLGVEQT